MVLQQCVQEVNFVFLCMILLYCDFAVQCTTLVAPESGNIQCSLGDDEIPSYEDNCSFTCYTGYELTGNNSRACQSDGSWNGTETMCGRGVLTGWV